MTLLALRARDDLLSVRFACSPAWETLAAVRTFVDERSRPYHEPWHRLVRDRVARLDLGPLLAVQPLEGFVPDFVSPPPRCASPRLRDQLDEIRATPPEQVVRELELARRTVDPSRRPILDSLLTDPARARDVLADLVHQAWAELVAPFWTRVRTLLDRDVELRSRTLARHGFARAVDELDPRISWTPDGIAVCGPFTVDGSATVDVGERGLILMPSAYSWPSVCAVLEEPWQPTLVYPVRGIAELWRAPAPPPDALARLLGRTRALVLASLDRPLSTTALAAELVLSPAGASRHLLALRDSGLVSASRHGHEVRYRRTALGSALLAGRRQTAA